MQPRERSNIGADPALFRLGPQKRLPLPDRDHEAGLSGFDRHGHGAIEKNHRADVARRKFVGRNRFVDCRRRLLGGDRQLTKAHDVRRVHQSRHVFVQAKYGRALVGRVAADSFKHAEAVLHPGTQKRHNPFAGGLQSIVHPYITSGSHGLLNQSWNLLRVPAPPCGGKAQDSARQRGTQTL